MVGRYQTRPAWRISWRQETRRTRQLLEPFGLDVDPATPLTKLTEVERAIIAIARAMSGLDSNGGLLVLDEATSRFPRDTAYAFLTRCGMLPLGVWECFSLAIAPRRCWL